MKKIVYIILKIIGAIVGILVVYVVAALALPLIPVPAEQTPEPKTIPIYIYTNGVHTDLVVPIKQGSVDWTQDLPLKNIKAAARNYQWLGIGWGDKGFYLDTPEWSDLKFSTAFNAAFWLSESAMHCTYYEEMKEGEDCKKIMLTERQYGDLVKFIKYKFDRDAAGRTILVPTDAVYGNADAFYEAKGRYNFADTCNTWTNAGLKAAGQRAALWTATDFGIFRHYK